jgi:hypothetical protein
MQAWYLCENPYLKGRSGFMIYAETEKGIEMFGEEVPPCLGEARHAPPV